MNNLIKLVIFFLVKWITYYLEMQQTIDCVLIIFENENLKNKIKAIQYGMFTRGNSIFVWEMVLFTNRG